MPLARVVLYAATLGVLVLTGRAVFGHPPPFVWAAFVLTGYAGLLLGGVLLLRWQVFVDAIVRGPRRARGVVLTFDDGPDPRWTPKILRTLAEHDAPATFFLVARKAEEHPEVVRAILDGGHCVGLHSYAHDRLFSLRTEQRVRRDLVRGLGALEKLTGKRPTIFRPPVGHTNPIIGRVADDLELTIVGWSVGGRDGVAGVRASDVVARVRRGLRDGAIVLLHDAAERGDREPAAVHALPAILDAIAAERLEVVALPRWLSDDDQEPTGSST
jgi:peptidoglycan/xylan/chitin deacetylase (PgdA/CDA1 family)